MNISQLMLQTDQLSTLQSLVANNMAVGFMFKELIKSDSNYSFIPTKTPICAEISLVWKKEAYILKAMRKLKEYIDKISIFQ